MLMRGEIKSARHFLNCCIPNGSKFSDDKQWQKVWNRLFCHPGIKVLRMPVGMVMDAIIMNYIHTLEEMYIRGFPFGPECYEVAAFYGRKDVISWLLRKRIQWTPNVLNFAIQSTDDDVFDFLVVMDCPIPEHAGRTACLYGTDRMIKFFIALKYKFEHDSIRTLVARGNVGPFLSLQENEHPLDFEDIAKYATFCNSINIKMWAEEQIKISKENHNCIVAEH